MIWYDYIVVDIHIMTLTDCRRIYYHSIIVIQVALGVGALQDRKVGYQHPEADMNGALNPQQWLLKPHCQLSDDRYKKRASQLPLVPVHPGWCIEPLISPTPTSLTFSVIPSQHFFFTSAVSWVLSLPNSISLLGSTSFTRTSTSALLKFELFFFSFWYWYCDRMSSVPPSVTFRYHDQLDSAISSSVIPAS